MYESLLKSVELRKKCDNQYFSLNLHLFLELILWIKNLLPEVKKKSIWGI